MDIATITCYIIIGFCIIMYVLLDGFDLGVGLLFPFVKPEERDVMMSTILPVWDGNQTWLVLGVAIFYGAFPRAFSMILPVLYLPLLIMVISLLLRGITFEFRLKEKVHRWIWDIIFTVSSLIITLCQGILLGSFVEGFDKASQGGLEIDLLTPFNITCGIALIFGYMLLGSTWVIAKSEGKLQKIMYKSALITLIASGIFLLIISVWSPFVDTAIWERWFSPNNFYKVITLPCMTAGLFVYFADCIRRKHEYRLYWITVLIFICSYCGFAISTWPYIVPHRITMWEAASPPSSQIFLLIGALFLLPILIGYTSYAYYIFRGKVKDIIDYD